VTPTITAPGESLPGATVSGATTVTPEPSADAQDGAELDGDAAALAVPVAPAAADELELPDEQPASANRAAVPQASIAPALATPRLLIIVSFRPASCAKKQHRIARRMPSARTSPDTRITLLSSRNRQGCEGPIVDHKGDEGQRT